MRRVFFFLNLLFFSTFCFAQQYPNLNVIGGIPAAGDNRIYKIQVGAFRVFQNAQRVFDMLINASFTPAYEIYLDYTRVVINGVAARDVPSYLQRIQNLGFIEVIIRVDTGRGTAGQTPVSPAAVPPSSFPEAGYCTIRESETVKLADLEEDINVSSRTSSTPVAGADSTESATIETNDNENISGMIVSQEDYYVVQESEVVFLPQESNTGEYTIQDITEYRTEPASRMSYRFNNSGEDKGASGINGGIDIIARDDNYQWQWTTFLQGGWFYDLNGVKREMVNGFQKDANNGVELTIRPEFVYDGGIPYLQLTHLLYNPGRVPVSGQKFGASADIMIHRNDNASLIHTPYGVRMTDSMDNPSLELIFICETGNGITPVDTLWLGTYDNGGYLDYIYTDRRVDVHGEDSAIGFSYQNIDIAPGDTIEFIVRFTLISN